MTSFARQIDTTPGSRKREYRWYKQHPQPRAPGNQGNGAEAIILESPPSKAALEDWDSEIVAAEQERTGIAAIEVGEKARHREFGTEDIDIDQDWSEEDTEGEYSFPKPETTKETDTEQEYWTAEEELEETSKSSKTVE